MQPIFYGMMNVRNEAEWIKEVLASMLTLCDFIFILDDHSTDKTAEICRDFSPRTRGWISQFDGLDKTRDKNFIYDRLLAALPASQLNENSPYWVLAIDGDEVLMPGGAAMIRAAAEKTKAHSLALQVLYLWDTSNQVRIDGCYASMYRPSVFHVINPAFRFAPTPFGGNLHCPNVPTELVGNHERIGARLKHYGYMRQSDRLRKFRFNQEHDPDNVAEDFYRHTVIGDLPSLPADYAGKHAGPLKIVPLESLLNESPGPTQG